MSEPNKVIEIIKELFPHRYKFAKLTKIPLLGNVFESLAFDEEDELICLPKNEVVQVNEYIESPESMALPSRVVEHFIEEANFRWKMDFCICRKANQCEDYPIDLGCLFLGEAAKGIPSEYGEPVTKEEALEHLEKCREAGLIHMIGRAKLDLVWLNVGPEGKLLTVCNCCPCCCICNTIPDASTGVGEKFQKMPGVNVEITAECVGCGTCTDVCFVDAIEIQNEQAKIEGECKGCGRCVDACPNDAIELTIKDSEFLNKSIKRLDKIVDVR